MIMRNVMARCLDMDSQLDVVMHEVEFDLQTTDGWDHMVFKIMATDPQDAIKQFSRDARYAQQATQR